ncbi:tetratricopeptide repeat protein [Hyphococcus flavus]|uniref:Tetratricopeptide repeat protein n=1 Tax=Hyphococcus flavus TaxID=1866326 RepID=A0AAE9ZIV7_9PROT|nr:tetratricopeptide repeat protein [Hyphococcus flavus]WDI31200.1 tetratricopeptide repeat protein [Hyphococcus flavus]
MQRLFIGFALIMSGSPAAAQMSVSTFGASEASVCFESASNDFSTNTKPCDEALEDAAITRSDRKKTLVNRGVIHNRNGDIAAAISDFDAALMIDNTLAEAYLNRGNSYFLASRLDEALADYQQALDLGVAQPWAAWYNIGLVHDARKEDDKAREAYQKALEENPDFTMAIQKLEAKN